ncbi:phage tail protein [Vibrio sp. Y184]|uniref:phage tail-collar fiber domain-containing protein n=1 Tax=Vibrio sp. Y184 TaxID=3074705 RepID=UPI002966B6D6|nr:phage tail protein [Vibrio sp. Y184]MDW3165432.1 phage tail protein [Vibrio sp. Y184]
MANSTDKSILTAAGKALLAQLNAEEKALVIDKMIFANVPNRPEYPQPDDVVPTDHIVHQEQVEQRGRLSADSVIYSSTLTSDVGPFDFNWTGAYCSEYGVLVTVDHHALTPKTADEPGVAGNTLVRSVVLEYKDIAEITNITVDASSWQYNATDRMKKMDSDVAQSIIDQNGKDWFIEDGFLVTPSGSAYNIKAGAGYVSGNRVSMEFDRSVQVPNKPSFIYIDAHREGTPTGEQVTLFDFVITAEEKDDYIDSSTGKDIPHFVCKIAEVLADGSVSDLRPEGESAGKEWVAKNEIEQTIMLSGTKKILAGKIQDIIGTSLSDETAIQVHESSERQLYEIYPRPEAAAKIIDVDVESSRLVTELATSFLFNSSPQGRSKTLYVKPTGGDDTSLLKAAIERGGVIDLGAEGTYYISDEVRATIDADVKILTRGAKIKYNGLQEINDVKTLINISGTGTEIVQTNVIIDGGMNSQNNFVPVCLTVRNVLMWLEGSTCSNAAAAANPVSVGIYMASNDVVYTNMYQTTKASSFGGTYGYGVVLVDVEHAKLSGGVYGKEDLPIHRHAVYASTFLDGSGACGTVICEGLQTEQIRYDDEGIEPITNFEYCYKSISSKRFVVNGTVTNGGQGFILCTTRRGATNNGYVSYDNNVVRTRAVGVGFYPDGDDGNEGSDTEENQQPWSRCTGGSGNVIILTSGFARAMRLQMIKNVHDLSTYIIEDTVNVTSAYNAGKVTSENPMAQLEIKSNIWDFQGVFVGGNVEYLDIDCAHYNPVNHQPISYAGPVLKKSIKITQKNKAVKYYQLPGNQGLQELRYYEPDFDGVIQCINGTSQLWVDANGVLVVGPSANRPSFVNICHPYYETDNNRFVYWSGSEWNLQTKTSTYPAVATADEMKALDDAILGWGAHIYCTTYQKPYWYDKYSKVFKDALQNEL